MEIKIENPCLFCNTMLTKTDEVNIQLNLTKQNRMNLEEFIKKSLLNLELHKILWSHFICLPCLELINQFEEFFIKSKAIQEVLVTQYNSNKVPTDEREKPVCETRSPQGSLFNTEETLIQDEKQAKKHPRKQNMKQFKIESANIGDNTQKFSELLGIKPVKPKEVNKDQMNDGLDMATEIQTYCCDKCGKEYTSISGFRMHMRKHKNENKFRCEICDKTFTQKICLQRHNNIHEGVHPYECDICGKKFIHMKSHKIHMDIHTGQRNIQCEICGRGFLTSSHLVRHMRGHTKEKPYPCPECGKPFGEKFNMRQHLKTHERKPIIADNGDVQNDIHI